MVIEGVDAVASVNWVGDIVMPIGVLAISLAASIWIAAESAAASRRSVEFQHDVRYADEFLEVIQMKHWGDLVRPPEKGQVSLDMRMHHARVRFTSRASGNAEVHLAGYLSGKEQLIWAMLSAYRDERRRMPQPALLSSRIGIDDDGYNYAANDLLHDMERMVRDWPFEERRQKLLREIAESYVDAWPVPPANRRLAIDKQLLHMAPSRFGPKQRYRRLMIWLREWRETIRYQRGGARVREWWRYRWEQVRHMRTARGERKQNDIARREAIGLRRLQELAAESYARQQLRVPFEFVIVPDRRGRRAWRE